jgi:RNA-directed DNA polymerase
MKRVNGLFIKIIDFQNLYSAYKKAIKGSPHSWEAKRFSFFLEKELLQLRNELLSNTYHPGTFKHYKIYDPKERLISVAPFRDRVVHHAIVKILEPIYESVFIFDSYATRKKKGTHAAILRVQRYLRNSKYYLKADIKKHFENMDHEILLDILTRKVKDKACLALIRTVIKGVPWNKGLPIGNLTSQFFANVYLDQFDHYIKEDLGVKKYVRYMDDMVFLSDSIDDLREIRKNMDQFLVGKLKLELKPGAVYINKQSNGISFLGARIFPEQIRIKPSCLRRCIKKLDIKAIEYQNGKINSINYSASLNSIIGHLDFFNTYQLRLNLGYANNWF